MDYSERKPAATSVASSPHNLRERPHGDVHTTRARDREPMRAARPGLLRHWTHQRLPPRTIESAGNASFVVSVVFGGGVRVSRYGFAPSGARERPSRGRVSVRVQNATGRTDAEPG